MITRIFLILTIIFCLLNTILYRDEEATAIAWLVAFIGWLRVYLVERKN